MKDKMKTKKSITIFAAIALAVLVLALAISMRGALPATIVSIVSAAVLAVMLYLSLRNIPSRRDNKALQDEIDSLKKTVRDLDRELAEKSRSRLNVVELNPILHIAVLDVDTSFVRPYTREEGKLTFQGALRADLRVEYGIRLEDVRFKYDEMANTLLLSNFHPGIISYSRKQLKWEFAKSFKSRKFLSDVSGKESDSFTASMCEKLRNELEQEIDTRKVSEFEWLSPMITGQVMDILKLMVGRESLDIRIIGDSDGMAGVSDDSYVSLQEFKQKLSVPQLKEQRVDNQEPEI